MPTNDSASFPFRFIDVHAGAVRDRHREQFFEVPMNSLCCCRSVGLSHLACNKIAKTRKFWVSQRRATMPHVLFTFSGAVLLITVLSIPTQAQQRPQIETTKVDGADNVYIFRNGNHQSMFVVTKDGVIATDPIAYGRPNGGQQYVDEIKKVTDKPIKYLIYSHHHYDHIAGGKAFKDAGATIIAHKKVTEHLAPLKDPNTPLPDQTTGDKKIIKLGGTSVELLYLGPNHSDSNLVIRLPRKRSFSSSTPSRLVRFRAAA